MRSPLDLPKWLIFFCMVLVVLSNVFVVVASWCEIQLMVEWHLTRPARLTSQLGTGQHANSYVDQSQPRVMHSFVFLRTLCISIFGDWGHLFVREWCEFDSCGNSSVQVEGNWYVDVRSAGNECIELDMHKIETGVC